MLKQLIAVEGELKKIDTMIRVPSKNKENMKDLIEQIRVSITILDELLYEIECRNHDKYKN